MFLCVSLICLLAVAAGCNSDVRDTAVAGTPADKKNDQREEVEQRRLDKSHGDSRARSCKIEVGRPVARRGIWMSTTERLLSLILTGVVFGGCYGGAKAQRDINEAWRGHHVSAIEDEWGRSAVAGETAEVTTLAWRHVRTRHTLPRGGAALVIGPGYVEGYAEIQPGQVRRHVTEVVAFVDNKSQIIREVRGPSRRWGPPNEENIHWGVLFGGHVGMGRLDDTATPLPSGGLYIGGMISRYTGLVGSFLMVSGIDDGGGAMGFAWAFAAQHWVTTRLSLRAGPAAILAFDPGFDNIGAEPALSAAASYALLKAGTFALDVRVDLAGGAETRFGTVGVGVNLN